MGGTTGWFAETDSERLNLRAVANKQSGGQKIRKTLHFHQFSCSDLALDLLPCFGNELETARRAPL